MRSSRRPPSEVYSKERERHVALQMRMPVHVWAMLSQGREAESVEIEQVVDRQGEKVKGVECRIRCQWRERDGQLDWERGDREGETQARQWKEWVVQRMVWVRKDGVWRGK